MSWTAKDVSKGINEAVRRSCWTDTAELLRRLESLLSACLWGAKKTSIGVVSSQHVVTYPSSPEWGSRFMKLGKRSRRCCRTMLNRERGAVLVVAGLLLGVPSLWAHHGLAAFDTKHTVRMQGTVTKFEWINPHAYIYADLTDENGKVANWKLEMGSLGMLTRFGGWTPNTVKPGDKVTVQGFRAKDGSPYMSLGKIELPNGQTLLGAP